MAVKVDLKINETIAALRRATEQANKKNATTIVNDVKRTISGGGTSNPNEPPASDTGNYRNSIKVFESKKEIGKYTTSIGSTERVQALSLEFGTYKMRARPHFRPSISRLKNVLRNDYILTVRNAI